MKTLNMQSYNEKLKINPVNMDDLDSIMYKMGNIKQNLHTFDIVHFNNKLYMTFLSDTINKLKINVADLNKFKHGIFLYYGRINEFNYISDYYYMYLDDYDYDLKVNGKYTNCEEFNVDAIYQCIDKRFTFYDLKKPIDQQYLNCLLETDNYKHIFSL